MKISVDKLSRALYDLSRKAGLNEFEAKALTDSTVRAEMRGLGSHGVVRIPTYIKRVELGLAKVNTPAKIEKDEGTLLLLDAQDALGAPVAMQAMRLCVERAAEKGCCFAGVHNGAHFGYGAFFTDYAAANGMIGFAVANANSWVAPFGGSKKRLGTNPLAISIPNGDKKPLTVDMATSQVAHGKILVADKKGEKIPLGWGVDSVGNATEDPKAVLNGGALLPFGGPKGYGISLIIELLCVAVAGGLKSPELGSMFDYTRTQGTGFFLGAINVSALMPREIFAGRVESVFEGMRSAAAEGKEVLIPGEIESRKEEDAKKNGIEIPEAVLGDLEKLMAQHQVSFEK